MLPDPSAPHSQLPGGRKPAGFGPALNSSLGQLGSVWCFSDSSGALWIKPDLPCLDDVWGAGSCMNRSSGLSPT